jgi:hypothetical protein
LQLHAVHAAFADELFNEKTAIDNRLYCKEASLLGHMTARSSQSMYHCMGWQVLLRLRLGRIQDGA